MSLSKENNIKPCDCSIIESRRFKDLTYNCNDGEKTVTIYMDYCEECGNVIDIYQR